MNATPQRTTAQRKRYRVEFQGCGAATVSADDTEHARRIVQHALLHNGCASVPVTAAHVLPLRSITPINESIPT